MIKIFILSLLLFSQSSFGQSLILLKNKINITQTTLNIVGAPSDEELVAHQIEVKNISGTPKEIQVKRYELSFQPDTYNFICWGICESPFNHIGGKHPFYILNTIVKITDSYNDFSAHYLPQSTKGTSEYRYVFFDVKNPSDSCWLNVTFNTNLSRNEEIKFSHGIKIFPNPVQDILKFQYDNERGEMSKFIEIHNINGKKITSLSFKNIGSENSYAEWPLSDDTGQIIENGVYFAKFIINNETIIQKIIVRR